jgi:MFS family permease
MSEYQTSEKQLNIEQQAEFDIESRPASNALSPQLPVKSNPEYDRYIQGWRLHAISAALCLGIFLSLVEVTIVATALVDIVDDLRNFDKASWIVNSYMLAFTSFLIIWAKLSDIYGRKLFIIVAVSIFVIFSALCGAAQTALQLIIFRAFQGLGGSGMYSITMTIFFDLVPPELYATYVSSVSVFFGLAMLLGPVIGGGITNDTTWRWIFLINVPFGCILVTMLAITIPNSFPEHHLPAAQRTSILKKFTSVQNLKKTDWIGTLLLLTAMVLLVASMEQAGLGNDWNSALVLSMLVISVVLWLAFTAWERRLTLRSGLREPVMPFRFLQSRATLGAIITDFLVGGPFTVGLVQIPQRFQTVHGLSPFQASLRLLPFGFLVPFGVMVGAGICKKAKLPIVYAIMLGSILQVIGFSLLSSTPHTKEIFMGQYGYQIIAGLGTGMTTGCLLVIMPFTVEERDKSVAVSAVIQFRTLGGTVFLAIVSSVFLNFIRANLGKQLSDHQVEAILKSTKALESVPAEIRSSITEIFSKGYNLQWRILVGVAAAQLPAALLIWKKDQIRA